MTTISSFLQLGSGHRGCRLPVPCDVPGAAAQVLPGRSAGAQAFRPPGPAAGGRSRSVPSLAAEIGALQALLWSDLAPFPLVWLVKGPWLPEESEPAEPIVAPLVVPLLQNTGWVWCHRCPQPGPGALSRGRSRARRSLLRAGTGPGPQGLKYSEPGKDWRQGIHVSTEETLMLKDLCPPLTVQMYLETNLGICHFLN